MNVNPAYRSHELRYVLANSRMKALFLHERDARANYLEILSEACDGRELTLEHSIVIGSGPWQELLARGEAPEVPVTPDEVANIQYTSGTTGAPKGVLLTSQFLLATAINFDILGEVDTGAVFLCDSPMFHVIGIVTQIWPPHSSRAMCIMAGSWLQAWTRPV